MKGTEILNGGKVLCSSSSHCEWVGYEGKHYLLSLLDYSDLSQGPEFHVLSELDQTGSWLAGREHAAEFPALALFSMCCYIPDCTLIVRPFLQCIIQQNCSALSSKTACLDSYPMFCCFQTQSLCQKPVNGSPCCLCCSGGPKEAMKLPSLLDITWVISFSCYLPGTELLAAFVRSSACAEHRFP